MTEIKITNEIALKVLQTVDAGLVAFSVGKPTPGQMGVEAVFRYVMGLPRGGKQYYFFHYLGVTLNDAAWTTPQARAKGLRRFAVAQLGSAGVLDEVEFVTRLIIMTVNTVLPPLLTSAGVDLKFAQACLTATTFTEASVAAHAAADAAHVTTYVAARRAARAAANAAVDAAHVITYVAARRATIAANRAASCIVIDTTYCAKIAAIAAYAVFVTANDAALSAFAEAVVQILIDMKAPGCQWLVLT